MANHGPIYLPTIKSVLHKIHFAGSVYLKMTIFGEGSTNSIVPNVRLIDALSYEETELLQLSDGATLCLPKLPPIVPDFDIDDERQYDLWSFPLFTDITHNPSTSGYQYKEGARAQWIAICEATYFYTDMGLLTGALWFYGDALLNFMYGKALGAVLGTYSFADWVEWIDGWSVYWATPIGGGNEFHPFLDQAAGCFAQLPGLMHVVTDPAWDYIKRRNSMVMNLSKIKAELTAANNGVTPEYFEFKLTTNATASVDLITVKNCNYTPVDSEGFFDFTPPTDPKKKLGDIIWSESCYWGVVRPTITVRINLSTWRITIIGCDQGPVG